MKHPEEDLISSLYEELSPAAQAELDKHLESCEQCRQKQLEWRATTRCLDRWKLEAPAGRSSAFLPWAIAASLLLGFGFLAGTFLTPATVQASRVDRLRQEMQQSLQQEVRADLVRLQEKITADLRAEAALENGNRHDESIMLASARLENHLKGFLEQLKESRAEDRKATLAMMEEMQKQLSEKVLLLRRDLETVAVLAENRIQQTQTRLGELALVSNRPGPQTTE